MLLEATLPNGIHLSADLNVIFEVFCENSLKSSFLVIIFFRNFLQLFTVIKSCLSHKNTQFCFLSLFLSCIVFELLHFLCLKQCNFALEKVTNAHKCAVQVILHLKDLQKYYLFQSISILARFPLYA